MQEEYKLNIFKFKLPHCQREESTAFYTCGGGLLRAAECVGGTQGGKTL